MDITVLCPTRGNPLAFRAAAQSLIDTAMADETSIVAVVDHDDPDLDEYVGLVMGLGHRVMFHKVPKTASGNMNLALNHAASSLVRWGGEFGEEIIGFVGDDHRFRTKGWDRVVSKVLSDEGGGLLYGDDLAQRDQLPTQVFITSGIVAELGWFGLPGAKHLYLDNTWKYLGENADCLFYCPDVVIEHMHPAYGKAEWDDNHLRVNDQAIYQHDAAVYEKWISSGQASEDVERVRLARSRA